MCLADAKDETVESITQHDDTNKLFLKFIGLADAKDGTVVGMNTTRYHNAG